MLEICHLLKPRKATTATCKSPAMPTKTNPILRPRLTLRVGCLDPGWVDRVLLRFGSGDGGEEPMVGPRSVGGGRGRGRGGCGGGGGGGVVGVLFGRSPDRSRYPGGGEESTVMGDLTTTMAVIRTVRVMEGIWMTKWVEAWGRFYGDLGLGLGFWG